MADADLRYTYLAKGRYWRFRHALTGDIAMPHTRGLSIEDQPRQPKFVAKYEELLARVERGELAPAPLDRRSFRWLIRRYQDSEEFRVLADPVNRRPKRTPYRRPKETPFVEQRDRYDGRAVRAGCGVGRA
ncbi:hypothetical protein HJG53_13955 [Sphingomonas sp. ID1715]|uniref:hypothetical protein n=1 Tax=Sphingomonas sp. ID1715 TaxID=1656898 RepID=UPI0014885A6D|nr:hypothetical protein [Sphingomonas sp. ID1715]NNM78006.1 hypothetical protein [Sphingomonas sp. ID1715]